MAHRNRRVRQHPPNNGTRDPQRRRGPNGKEHIASLRAAGQHHLGVRTRDERASRDDHELAQPQQAAVEGQDAVERDSGCVERVRAGCECLAPELVVRQRGLGRLRDRRAVRAVRVGLSGTGDGAAGVGGAGDGSGGAEAGDGGAGADADVASDVGEAGVGDGGGGEDGEAGGGSKGDGVEEALVEGG